jgi:hypothetical protein
VMIQTNSRVRSSSRCSVKVKMGESLRDMVLPWSGCKRDYSDLESAELFLLLG